MKIYVYNVNTGLKLTFRPIVLLNPLACEFSNAKGLNVSLSLYIYHSLCMRAQTHQAFAYRICNKCQNLII